MMVRYGRGGCFRPRLSRLRLGGYQSIGSRDARGRVLLGGLSGHSLQIVRLVPRRAEAR
jgi:hypothetical protein